MLLTKVTKGSSAKLCCPDSKPLVHAVNGVLYHSICSFATTTSPETCTVAYSSLLQGVLNLTLP